MPKDPGILDTCLFMEAIAGDGGAHDPLTGTWWLSPDVQLTSNGGVADVADKNKSNNITVRVHKKASCALPGGSTVLVDVYVGNPSLAMAPGSISTKLVATPLLSAASLAGGVATVTAPWTPTGSGTDADSPGHRCLIARCSRDTGDTPDAAAFHVEDQHYCQHNITIVETANDGMVAMKIMTGNPDRAGLGGMKIQVLEDIKPATSLVRLITPSMKASKSFKEFASTQSRNFAVNMTKFERSFGSVIKTGPALNQIIRPGVRFDRILNEGVEPTAVLRPGQPLKAVITRGTNIATVVNPNVDKAIVTGGAVQAVAVNSNLKVGANGRFGTLAKPNLQVALNTKPGFFSTFDFNADVAKSKPGTAHVFHLSQVGNDKRPHGGLTVIVVRR